MLYDQGALMTPFGWWIVSLKGISWNHWKMTSSSPLCLFAVSSSHDHLTSAGDCWRIRQKNTDTWQIWSMTPIGPSLRAKVLLNSIKHFNNFPSIRNHSVLARLKLPHLKKPFVLSRSFSRLRTNLRQHVHITEQGIFSGAVPLINTDLDSVIQLVTKKVTADQDIRDDLVA